MARVVARKSGDEDAAEGLVRVEAERAESTSEAFGAAGAAERNGVSGRPLG